MRSLQTTSRTSRRDHSITARGDYVGLHAVYIWVNIFSASFYRQHCAQRNAPVFKLLRGSVNSVNCNRNWNGKI